MIYIIVPLIFIRYIHILFFYPVKFEKISVKDNSITFQQRGTIYDRNGDALVYHKYRCNFYVQPYIDKKSVQYLKTALVPYIKNESWKISQKLNGYSGKSLYLGEGKICSIKESDKLLKSYVEVEYTGENTLLPFSDAVSGVIGGLNAKGEAISGIENMADEDLKKSKSVKLTIDKDMQIFAYSSLMRQVQATGADSGWVTIEDPFTGEVLAAVNYPASSDQNLFTSAYEAGSVIKPVVVASLVDRLKSGTETYFSVPDTMECGKIKISDDFHHGILQLQLKDIIAKSSNVGMNLALDSMLSDERAKQLFVFDTLRDFGFNKKVPEHFPGASKGFISNINRWSRSLQCTSIFGQGIKITALQLSAFYSAVANGGTYIPPHLLTDKKVEKRRLFSSDTSTRLSQMLNMVVSQDGTAFNTQIENYYVAGKTGTAQNAIAENGVLNYKNNVYTSSFIGIISNGSRSYVINTSIYHPRTDIHFGSYVSGPVFREIAKYLIYMYKL